VSELPVEERFQDVLQNVEFGIMQVYREHPEMTDWDALDAVQALIRTYQAEARGRQATTPSLRALPQKAYDSARLFCEWRLGREIPFNETEQPFDFSVQPLSPDEMVACLKRIRKSINRWRRQGGRQGYLTYVSQFVQ
jgi:hypothetical protein